VGVEGGEVWNNVVGREEKEKGKRKETARAAEAKFEITNL
jgi:hypothetical protein